MTKASKSTNASESPLIQLAGVEKRFGTRPAVAGLTLEVRRGEILGLLGPNGAGKSTTLRMASGFLEPDAGSVTIGGFDLRTDGRRARAALGYLPEGAPGYELFSPREFFTFIGRARGMSTAAIASRLSQVEALVDLGAHMRTRFEHLSKGYRRRVALGAALFADPPVLLLDEPTDGLDPNQKRALRRDLRALARNKAILVSTHILEEVPALCDRLVMIDAGRVVFRGTPAELSELGAGSLDRAFASITEARA